MTVTGGQVARWDSHAGPRYLEAVTGERGTLVGNGVRFTDGHVQRFRGSGTRADWKFCHDGTGCTVLVDATVTSLATQTGYFRLFCTTDFSGSRYNGIELAAVSLNTNKAPPYFLEISIWRESENFYELIYQTPANIASGQRIVAGLQYSEAGSPKLRMTMNGALVPPANDYSGGTPGTPVLPDVVPLVGDGLIYPAAGTTPYPEDGTIRKVMVWATRLTDAEVLSEATAILAR